MEDSNGNEMMTKMMMMMIKKYVCIPAMHNLIHLAGSAAAAFADGN